MNDGVRLNIRPFSPTWRQDGILRKHAKIKWDKDRGKEPVREKKDFPWFWGWDETNARLRRNRQRAGRQSLERLPLHQ